MERTVVITGVGRGLGLALAEHLVAEGDQVWGTVRPGRRGAADDIGLAGVIEMDLSDGATIRAGIEPVLDAVDRVDLLINNAGIDARALGVDATARGPFDLDPASMIGVIDTNVMGPMVLTTALRSRLAAASGQVVNVSSQLGSMVAASTMGSDTAYCVSKAALNMWTVKAAAELGAEGVTMIALHPGWVQTDMGGPNGSLTTEESAAGIVATIGRLTPADNGSFLQWDGSTHPW